MSTFEMGPSETMGEVGHRATRLLMIATIALCAVVYFVAGRNGFRGQWLGLLPAWPESVDDVSGIIRFTSDIPVSFAFGAIVIAVGPSQGRRSAEDWVRARLFFSKLMATIVLPVAVVGTSFAAGRAMKTPSDVTASLMAADFLLAALAFLARRTSRM